jgi:hypothetical protein
MIIILTLLAVARATRLITSDRLTEAPRNRVLQWLTDRNPDSLLAYLIVCDWCASVYVGAAAAGAYAAWGETMPFMVVVLALSASYVTGFLASKTEG